MSLYTDSPVFTIEELVAHETSILDMASGEGIDLTAKIGLAVEEVGMELLSSLRRLGNELGLGHVVVTPPLRLWQIFHTLEVAYRDAYHNQLNDRYKGKWQEYRELARWASGLLFQIGVGMVTAPIPEPAAPTLSSTPGPLSAGPYFVRVAWRNGNGEEGASSVTKSIELGEGSALRVRVESPPPNTTGWNVYAGVMPTDLYAQNTTPLPAESEWTSSGALILSGKRPGNGQEPLTFRQAPRILSRG